ncbi:SWI5-dependent HO expression protein 4 [Elasticomyces elasticus]|uniref:SWI5-dependent HO expression protein 4 n=1 Tax=Exophiala sideris TaxID=1016849 RepID=A0ABR0JHS3_9EURO|nr:SWI5-dependent HO expression protein 4 [Elasticomyces elasticus]KAK5034148.1 SWI5-dependent HO expression protein 4 [Exophiala sideris]KAK5042444.1 SWI5-dependent HO expression protein 4 [Exophiala sideris]KAK5065526.1 SWI5-dependent HO expression protein 4 [Exophiala sideris]KAK5186015.1 SWI5-dependent HO expression protein 4 [Eurotiomycetes sp. CCFEE 6388]
MAAVQRMTRKLSEERASHLANEAVELSHSGDKLQASRKLREAAALAADSPLVQAAFLAIHNDQHTSPLRDLCRKFALYHNNTAGDEAVKYLKSSDAPEAAPVALESLQIILENPSSSLSSAQDFIIAELARQSPAVRQYFASELQTSTTEFFDNVYDRGDDAANCLRSVVLDNKLWTSEDVRLRVEDDLFQLFLAKLMESGHDHDGRALKGIALLLIADTQRLQHFIDEDAFEALMGSLDIRLPPDVRGQATLVLSRFFEVAESTGQGFLDQYIRTHVQRQKGDDLVLAFSGAAHLFPVVPAMVAQLFLTEGFLPSIMALLGRQSSNAAVQDSLLMLLNAACLDGACRAAVAQYCSTWLSHKVSNGTGKQPSIAATILAKLRTSGVQAGDQRANRADEDVSDLVDLLKQALSAEEGRNVSDSLEGLAYSSLRSGVKDSLAKDRAFLKNLLDALDTNHDSPEVVVGGLSIISNLTQYTPNLSEEQKRVSQLKAYANASKPVEPSPLEDDEHVRDRCSAVVEAGLVATLTRLNKGNSPATAHLTDRILVSLTKNPKDRGKIAQQGAVKLLISHAQRNLQSSEKNSQPDTDAAHALARVLISLNPSHVFAAGSTPHITDAVPPLVALLKASRGEVFNDQPRDLLPVFESLLALTNLASAPDETAANSIIKLGWDEVEQLLLGHNDMLRRAACELICNLTIHPAGVEKFADDSKRAATRLHLLVALADVEDVPTRRAAGGALAMLTDQYSPVVSALLDFKRTPEILLELCLDDDAGVVHRGLVASRNMVCEEDESLAVRARKMFKEQGAVEKLKTCLKKTRDPNMLQIGVEALKVLVQ